MLTIKIELESGKTIRQHYQDHEEELQQNTDRKDEDIKLYEKCVSDGQKLSFRSEHSLEDLIYRFQINLSGNGKV